jgi:hypothetical protein
MAISLSLLHIATEEEMSIADIEKRMDDLSRKRYIYQTLTNAHFSRTARWLYRFDMLAVLLSILVFIVETDRRINNEESFEAWFGLEAFLTAYFTLGKYIFHASNHLLMLLKRLGSSFLLLRKSQTLY